MEVSHLLDVSSQAGVQPRALPVAEWLKLSAYCSLSGTQPLAGEEGITHPGGALS